MAGFEADRVVVESLPDKIDGTHTENGGYEVTAIKNNGPTEVFGASALNLNGFAFSAAQFSIAEYRETILVEQETDGGHLNLEVQKNE